MTESGIERARPGGQLEIRGHVFDILSRSERVAPSEGLTGFTIMSVEHDPLTDKTVSRLQVNTAPFELDVCNGPTYEVAPDDVRSIDSESERSDTSMEGSDGE